MALSVCVRNVRAISQAGNITELSHCNPISLVRTLTFD